MATQDQQQKHTKRAQSVQQLRISLPMMHSDALLRQAREWESQRVGTEAGSDYRTALNRGLVQIYRILQKRLGDDNQDRVLPLPAGRGPFGIALDEISLPQSGSVNGLLPFNRLDTWVQELQGFDSKRPQKKDDKLKQAPPRPPSRDLARRAPGRMRRPGPILDDAGGAEVGRRLARTRAFSGDAGSGFLDSLIAADAKKPSAWSEESFDAAAKPGPAAVARGLQSFLQERPEVGDRRELDRVMEARKVGVRVALEALKGLPQEKMGSGAMRGSHLIRAVKSDGALSRDYNRALLGGRGGPVEEHLKLAIDQVAHHCTRGTRQAESKVQRKGEEEKREKPKEEETAASRHKALTEIAAGALQKLAPALR